MKFRSNSFKEIWAVDFEFFGGPGDLPTPVCMVAHELISGKKLRIWQDKLQRMTEAPYNTNNESLFVAYYASAEISCHLVLGWPVPENVLDLFTEFRNLTNGKPLPCGRGLIGALTWFGLNCMEALEKETMRDLILTGGPWNEEEKAAILKYCEADVRALNFLLEKMGSYLDIPRALLRGRYMTAAAKIENNGIPIDTRLFNNLKDNWNLIKEKLITKIDENYTVFKDQSFSSKRFAKWLVKNDIPWPRLESGALDLKDETFKERASAYPEIAPLRELRVTLSQLRLSNLAIGKDYRNRCLLSAFQARTSRNAPSTSKFIFGPSKWLRGLIKPIRGKGLAYIDWSQQEFGIAAKLSGDRHMQEAYYTGDAYLAFGKQIGAIPPNASKKSHYAKREQFKACVLGVNYGMGEQALAAKIGQPIIVAREMLKLHRDTYRDFWRWSNGALDYAMFHGLLWTTFGWQIHIDKNPNPRMLRNFLIQANGAEMLRLAICLALNRGITICAPIHDALLIEAPMDQLEENVKITQDAMAEASRIILDGFELKSEAKIIRYPDRYMDKRGQRMWNVITEILTNI